MADWYYPAFLNITGKKAVVVGGGAVAERKALSLLDAGALVTVISPAVAGRLNKLADNGRLTLKSRAYRKGDLAGAAIAFAATDSPEANLRVASEAEARGIPVNCASPPDAGSFIVPSSIHQAGLTIAISTSGGSPALAKKLRRDLEAFLGGGYGEFLRFLEGARKVLKEKVPEQRLRAAILTRLAESGLDGEFRTRPAAEARKVARRMLKELMAEAGM